MTCNWVDIDHGTPPNGTYVVAKYSSVRSDCPFSYLISIYDDGWKQEYMIGGYYNLRTIPTPDWWALIEYDKDYEHG